MKELSDLINEVLIKTKKINFINQLALEIQAKNDISMSLSEVNRLSYLLYAINEVSLALFLCEVLKQYEFDGNFDNWTWIQSSIVLMARIYRQNGNTKGADDCMKIIDDTFFIGTEIQQKIRKKALVRRLNGELLYDEKIKIAIQRGDKPSELERRISQMKELCFIKEMGGSEVYPPERVEELFMENHASIKKLLTELE